MPPTRPQLKWWYGVILVGNFVLGIVVLAQGHRVGWWSILVCLLWLVGFGIDWLTYRHRLRRYLRSLGRADRLAGTGGRDLAS